MEYRVDDRSLSGETFLDFVQQVWPGAYNLEQTRAALSKNVVAGECAFTLSHSGRESFSLRKAPCTVLFQAARGSR